MKPVKFPEGFRVEALGKAHPRSAFCCGRSEVDSFLSTKALQAQDKHLSTTRVLVAPDGALAGYYTLAVGQVDFGELPSELAKKLPRRALPVAVLAWLGVSGAHQGQGLGTRLLVQALRDCHAAGETFAFVALVVDCLDDDAKAFYAQWDFKEMPGCPYRLFLSVELLKAIVADTKEKP